MKDPANPYLRDNTGHVFPHGSRAGEDDVVALWPLGQGVGDGNGQVVDEVACDSGARSSRPSSAVLRWFQALL
jgi:hypothetical protein